MQFRTLAVATLAFTGFTVIASAAHILEPTVAFRSAAAQEIVVLQNVRITTLKSQEKAKRNEVASATYPSDFENEEEFEKRQNSLY